jgi:predicted enzyme related to lactoylglutathione lyase
MEGRVMTMSLVVKDKAKALAFFTEKAGFEKKTDATGPGGYRYVTVGFKGQDLELALWETGSTTDPSQQEWSKSWVPGGAPPIVIQVTDCRQAYQELSSRGVTFPQPPMDHPWGTVATFRDPDGNAFSLSQLKGQWSQK